MCVQVEPKPFVKWVGGKRKLLPRLRERCKDIRRPFTYFEPFVGGGALFWSLNTHKANLTDTNSRLIRTYTAIQQDVESVIDLLGTYPHDKTFYLDLRSQDIDHKSDVEVASWFLYLNRTGFNGLYRVNKKGQFNVPFGSQKNPTICNAPLLRACSDRLQGVSLGVESFNTVANKAKSGDLVYFDPPYVPLSVTSSFTSYTIDGFTLEDQVKLRDVAIKLKQEGVHVIVSNSSAPLVYELYGDGIFNLEEVSMARAINCKAESRGAVKELLIY